MVSRHIVLVGLMGTGKTTVGRLLADRLGRSLVDSDELMIISKNGVLIRLPIANVSMVGRNTQGVRMIRLDEGDAVVGVARIVKEEGEGGEVEPTGGAGGSGAGDAGGGEEADA